MKNNNRFLPMTKDEMSKNGWDACDFIIVTGDAYVDHPSFGAAVIGRVLEAEGFRVGIISQPSWDSCRDFTVLGKPALAFLITSGNLDSMVAGYTSSGKPRSTDAFTPGGAPGKRPDRAVISYTSRARQAYKNIPVIIGGLEASLRRLSHYDFWSDKIRRSLLLDAKADLLVYGMAESAIRSIAAKLKQGEPITAIKDIPGTVYACKSSTTLNSLLWPTVTLPAYDAVSERDAKPNIGTDAGKLAFAGSCQLRLLHENPLRPERLAEDYGSVSIIQNPPAIPLTTNELDNVYDLPFTREAHPSYQASSPIPALQEIKFSILSNRGCYGGCSFCALTSHQGRTVQVRSHTSILKEISQLTTFPDYKGYIHDIGGPTANFRSEACKKQGKAGPCSDKMCLFPEPCPSLQDSHKDYLELLKKARSVPGVKKVFIRSGIRYDYLLSGSDPVTIKKFIHELTLNHISGQLKVAPEHVSETVLDLMGKPGISSFVEFSKLFTQENREHNMNQYIIPYFISGHPGSTLNESILLAEFLRDHGFIPEQVQDFYPTPGTVSTCMYYSGMDPRPGRNFSPVYIPKGREKRQQRALIHYHKPENRKLVVEALNTAGRPDLIGPGKNCLVRNNTHSYNGYKNRGGLKKTVRKR
ncbi:MAG: YgiQ family radical SAM protein [Bacteroidetes bacterium]|nr:YgiQ family radical SAM protein [Bacteroidota bacterium]